MARPGRPTVRNELTADERHPITASKGRQRFAVDRLEGLTDAPRPGRDPEGDIRPPCVGDEHAQCLEQIKGTAHPHRMRVFLTSRVTSARGQPVHP
jgi:hypothetical protein